MRILHLVLAPRLSGAEVLARDLAVAQQEAGDIVGVASLLPAHSDFATMRADLERAGVSCDFPQRRMRAPGRLWHLLGVLRRFRPDVVFAHATIPAFYARALPWPAPVVYVMHSAVNDFERPLFRIAERLLSRRASAVVAVAQSNVSDYRAAVGSHPGLRLIPNGVDMRRFAAPAAPDAEAATVADGPLVVQLGRYTAVKNQLHTVRAFAEMLRVVPAARLALYGVIEDPSYHASVQALVGELQLGEQVSVNGPRGDIPQLLAQASVFAMPSASEAHSIAFLEALATGVPVVASAIPAFRFADGFQSVQLLDTGDIGAYAEALVRAAAQPRARRGLEGLTLEDTLRGYRVVAREVVGIV